MVDLGVVGFLAMVLPRTSLVPEFVKCTTVSAFDVVALLSFFWNVTGVRTVYVAAAAIGVASCVALCRLRPAVLPVTKPQRPRPVRRQGVAC